MKNKIKLSFVILISVLLGACSNSLDIDGNEKAYAPDGSGKGGSMARFTIDGDYLYTVNSRSLKTFDISTPSQPVESSETYIGWDIETIFSYNNYLFIGSNSGMYIYDTTDPSTPNYVSDITHFFSCDPVVASGNYAYVTLHSESRCSRSELNELQIIDISDIKNPFKVGNYAMQSPKGLGIDDSLLFVCDAGLKVFRLNESEYSAPTLDLIEQINIDATDLIPINDLLIITGESGIHQYNYKKGNLKYLSSLFSIKTK